MNASSRALLVIGLIIGGAIGLGLIQTRYQPQITQLQSEVDQKTEAFDAVQLELDTVQSEKESIETSYLDLQSDYSDLETQYTTLYNDTQNPTTFELFTGAFSDVNKYNVGVGPRSICFDGTNIWIAISSEGVVFYHSVT